MILTAIGVLVLGLVTGVATDALLRGRDARSAGTVVASVIGAIAGVFVRYAIGPDDALLRAFSALVGALLAAFVIRAHVSATAARGVQATADCAREEAASQARLTAIEGNA